ncbi:GHKL domain-containing protein [Bacillus aquiflavi]|uniref:histidine kinase n=1 Tax=Bacillus aquiflavi TaxID=2672567 RepID=A0A6B3VSQ7_9BACI|nr:histidine kinase N-terminal domain-containing protein [Bacillus aquiflavi]MBA4535626.1 GHKL domain-containing protein [Bacillus aquiflavi]NEY80002.1 GHKL domain-containing protein [Bacillus aquiflavi]
MTVATKEKLFDFLKEKGEELISGWEQKVLVRYDPPFSKTVIENGKKMYYILLESYYYSNDELEKKLKSLARRVAENYVTTNMNVGECAFTVNLARSILLELLNDSNLSLAEIRAALKRMNYLFDQFLYYTVTQYTDAKNKIIEEKTNYIDSTHKDRLTLLGQMTSSFIHEFRNPLTSVQGFIQLLRAEHPDMNYLNIISNELDQLNFRISQFLLLSKKELIGKEKTVFSLNEMLEEVLIFLYPSILDGKVKVMKEIEENLYLFGYADEFRQVFINIIFNAIDVLSHNCNDPTIKITATLTEGKKILVAIANNGPMIPSHLLATIFEPFVTTKKLGTGLGLFVCREIIEKHKGSLSCISEPNCTAFIIRLPAAEGKLA